MTLKLLAFQVSFDIGELNRTLTLASYQAAGATQGFDGTALFLEDTNPVSPSSSSPPFPRRSSGRHAPAASPRRASIRGFSTSRR